MKKFDLKKAILENKATFHSSLSENESTYEGKKSKKYYKDAEADDAEHIKALEKDMKDDKKSSKMTKSKLKAKIKEMVLSEMTLDVDKMEDAPESEVDFLEELEEMLNEGSPMNDPRTAQIIQMLNDMEVDGETMEYILRQVGMDDQMSNQLVNYPAEYAASLNEADETEKDTAEVDTTDVTVDDTETTDVETTAEVDPNVKAVQDSLTQAQAAAQALGDKKLIDQIGNTITFFTRAHVVEKPKGAVTEADEIELSNMQYVLDWWEELPFEKKKEIFHKEHEAEDDINRFRMNESMFPMLNKILK